MPHLEVLWIEGPDGNVEHLAEHGVSPAEAEDVLADPTATAISRSSGHPIVFGYTRHRRKLAVVYQMLDDLSAYPITAYDVED
ncbi:hypothetical protein ACERK3_14115 [Phycisphaerales bacterium AB-hyl4]|uniref:DUF4258 domain-containing protein n=1 Tax=Natronomicrosphaera hydrolytica TaxID=3242702 RepID=A0ABV4U754_9BACT